jgi:hypothetical protein
MNQLDYSPLGNNATFQGKQSDNVNKAKHPPTFNCCRNLKSKKTIWETKLHWWSVQILSYNFVREYSYLLRKSRFGFVEPYDPCVLEKLNIYTR